MKFKYNSNNLKLGFSTNILKNILKARGIDNVDKFLNLNDSVLEDYNDFTNINVAGELLLEHINNESDIAILVDYDLDGYTSASLMYLEIKELCKLLKKPFKVNYIIHSKKSHGLDSEIMDILLSGNNDLTPYCNLLLIPDASSNDFSQHKLLFDNGIDIVVLDHHPVDRYSEYACVVNNQLSNKINNKAMTGVGVVYKYCKWLDNRLNIKIADSFLDLVALGMIGDSADMRNLETRYLTLKGLKLIEENKNENKLISELFTKKAFSLKNKATINGFAFYMCPAINCIIRGGEYNDKIKLFEAFINSNDTVLTKIRGKGEVEVAVQEYIIRLCDKLKRKQNKTVDAYIDLLDKQIEQYNLNSSEIMVINGDIINDSNYNRVIVNKIANKYNKHSILLKPKDEIILGGSASGVRNKSITNFKKWCKDTKLFTLAEGHDMAFGVQIPINNINNLYEIIGEIPSDDILVYNVDYIFNDKTLNKNIVNMIGNLHYIWGNKLDEPLFAMENLIIDSNDVYINEGKTTIKFIYKDIEFIKFKTNEELYENITNNKINKFVVIGKFSLNEYNGVCKPQIIIEDLDFEATDVKRKFTI